MSDVITLAVDGLFAVKQPSGHRDGGPGRIYRPVTPDCPTCIGVGYLVERLGIGYMKVACGTCDGTGEGVL